MILLTDVDGLFQRARRRLAAQPRRRHRRSSTWSSRRRPRSSARRRARARLRPRRHDHQARGGAGGGALGRRHGRRATGAAKNALLRVCAGERVGTLFLARPAQLAQPQALARLHGAAARRARDRRGRGARLRERGTQPAAGRHRRRARRSSASAIRCAASIARGREIARGLVALLVGRGRAHREAAGARDRAGARLLERRRGDPPRRSRVCARSRRHEPRANRPRSREPRARRVASARRELSAREKDAWLLRSAERLEAARERILAANAEDVREARGSGVAEPLVNRLELSTSQVARHDRRPARRRGAPRSRRRDRAACACARTGCASAACGSRSA